MKNLKKLVFWGIAILFVFASATSVEASWENNGERKYEQGVLVTIDGVDYSPSQFMDRVIECTENKGTAEDKLNDAGYIVSSEYDESGKRTILSVDKLVSYYKYDAFGRLIHENRNNGVEIDYFYDVDGLLEAFDYKGDRYHYVYNEKKIIVGLMDANDNIICHYKYNEFGNPTCDTWNFVGDCINPYRYNQDYYVKSLGLYLLGDYAYYDANQNVVISADVFLNEERLYGHETIFHNYANLSATQVSLLMQNAQQYYSNNLYRNNAAFSGNAWYTSLSGNNDFFLCARIIYAENGYRFAANEDKGVLNNLLKNNRQAEGWIIVNRLLEDLYRYNHSLGSQFSTFQIGELPSVYSVLTYMQNGLAFSSLNSDEAKSAVDPFGNVAYQEAFWIACCIKVCSNFDEWNTIVARPTGVTYQCYNKGSLSYSSAPSSGWGLVYIPGCTTNFTNRSSYAGFPYRDNFEPNGESWIKYFNVVHSYPSETLKIVNLYYN